MSSTEGLPFTFRLCVSSRREATSVMVSLNSAGFARVCGGLSTKGLVVDVVSLLVDLDGTTIGELVTDGKLDEDAVDRRLDE